MRKLKQTPARIVTLFVDCDLAGNVPTINFATGKARRYGFGKHRVEVVIAENSTILAVHADCDCADRNMLATVASDFVEGETCFAMAERFRSYLRATPRKGEDWWDAQHRIGKKVPAELRDAFEKHVGARRRAIERRRVDTLPQRPLGLARLDAEARREIGLQDVRVSPKKTRTEQAWMRLTVGGQTVASRDRDGRWSVRGDAIAKQALEAFRNEHRCTVCIGGTGRKTHTKSTKHQTNFTLAILRATKNIDRVLNTRPVPPTQRKTNDE